jgi:hypothetical protein
LLKQSKRNTTNDLEDTKKKNYAKEIMGKQHIAFRFTFMYNKIIHMN